MPDIFNPLHFDEIFLTGISVAFLRPFRDMLPGGVNW